MGKVYQVSTISALAMGYTKSVVDVEDLLRRGDTGLGAFEHMNGEMIVLDGICYQAQDDGRVYAADRGMGVSFAAVGFIDKPTLFDVEKIEGSENLRKELNLKIEEEYGLNSVHIARIDGTFEKVRARSQSPLQSHHIELKDILKDRQEDFTFEKTKGTIVCIYYPDYLESINAPGWHFHFISEDRRYGGHVIALGEITGRCSLGKMDRIDMQLPKDKAFDTYMLKEAKQEDIKKVELS